MHQEDDEDEMLVAWYDATLAANVFWQMPDVEPQHAATILCGQNPLVPKSNPEITTTDEGETTPEDYRRLLTFFEAVRAADKEKQARTLIQWRAIARDHGLKCHSWFDKYAAANAMTGAGATAKRHKWTDAALKELWGKSNMSGVTQAELAKEYGITHQSISKQLARARVKFAKGKSKSKGNWHGIG